MTRKQSARPIRVPNLLQWGLDDILGALAETRMAYNALRDYADRRNDRHLKALLLDLLEPLSEAERKARNARGGIYEE